jgi:hypothetical protein
MMTDKVQIKIMDFGLAKLAPVSPGKKDYQESY